MNSSNKVRVMGQLIEKPTHSKGPWTVDTQVDERGNGHISIRAAPTRHPTIGVQVCSINESVDLKLCGANARLIAAAPELLEWAQKAMQMAKQQGTPDDKPLDTAWFWLYQRLSEVIYKATLPECDVDHALSKDGLK